MKPRLKDSFDNVCLRAGRVRELARSFRSEFKLFGIRSIQFSSIGTSLSGKFVQFRAAGPSASVQFAQFSSVHKLFRPWFPRKVRSARFGAQWPSASVQFSSLSSFHELFRRDVQPKSDRHISAGAGAVGTFCSELEPEPSKKVSVPAPKERKNHEKKRET